MKRYIKIKDYTVHESILISFKIHDLFKLHSDPFLKLEAQFSLCILYFIIHDIGNI